MIAATAARRILLLNSAALIAALAAAGTGALLGAPGRTPSGPTAANDHVTTVERVPLPGGGEGIADASGQVVPLRPYRRLVSTNLVTDRLFVELVDADRILAFSAAGVRGSPWRHQYAGKLTVEGMGGVEPILAVRPDLVVMHSYGVSRTAGKLREAGVEVFDLGELRGVESLVWSARRLAAIVGAPERGERFAAAFTRRLAAVAAPLGAAPRRRAIYLAALGHELYGGTRGTSHYDILTAAGLIDVAATKHRDWPQYRAEDVIALSPEVVVTKEGLAAAVCSHPGLDRLAACQRPGLILELPAALLDEPGPAMLDAAELLFAKAYPALAGPPAR